MKKLNYDDLKTYIEGNKERVAVVMTTDHCTKCSTLLHYIESKLVAKYPTIEFVEYNTDDIPLFAPPAVPSVIFFKNSLRTHEGHGLPEPIEAVDNVIDWWLEYVL